MSAPSGFERFLELPELDRKVLQERAKEIARVPEAAEDGDRIEVLEIASRGQTYALPLSAVEGISELVSIAAVPVAPPFVRGLVSFRGEVLIAIELAAVVGGAVSGFADLRRVVAVGVGGMKLAVLAERVLAIRPITPQSFKASAVMSQPFVVGTDERLLTLLDASALVAHVVRAVGGGNS